VLCLGKSQINTVIVPLSVTRSRGVVSHIVRVGSPFSTCSTARSFANGVSRLLNQTANFLVHMNVIDKLRRKQVLARDEKNNPRVF
jgi:hypothetical protein